MTTATHDPIAGTTSAGDIVALCPECKGSGWTVRARLGRLLDRLRPTPSRCPACHGDGLARR